MTAFFSIIHVFPTFVYNIDLEYVAWNGGKLDIKLLGKYVLL